VAVSNKVSDIQKLIAFNFLFFPTRRKLKIWQRIGVKQWKASKVPEADKYNSLGQGRRPLPLESQTPNRQSPDGSKSNMPSLQGCAHLKKLFPWLAPWATNITRLRRFDSILLTHS
jgi:hypothetical protein